MRAEIIPVEAITRVIYALRGQRVLLDRDLTARYGAETRALNQAVKRNAAPFPSDFMFQLSRQETRRISQSVTSFSHLKFRNRSAESVLGDALSDEIRRAGSSGRAANISGRRTKVDEVGGLRFHFETSKRGPVSRRYRSCFPRNQSLSMELN